LVLGIDGKSKFGGASQQENVTGLIHGGSGADSSVLLRRKTASGFVELHNLSLGTASELTMTPTPDFLRLSRSTIDDSIAQNLNALVTPAQRGFDPSSTAMRQTDSRAREAIDPSACQGFKDNVLFPSWQTRSDVLNYCAGVATSPDPEDPDLILRETESARDRERVVNERLDPYSARFFPREARTESLANVVRNQRTVEEIIRARTWGMVTERCGGASASWEDALNTWRQSHRR
jgi:hypothetical protein